MKYVGHRSNPLSYSITLNYTELHFPILSHATLRRFCCHLQLDRRRWTPDTGRYDLIGRALYDLRDSGEILPLSRGIYQLKRAAGNDAIDFITVCARAPKGMICLNSALTHWDLSDEIPRTVHLAVPKGTHRPTIDHPPTDIHVFAADTFQVGLVELSESPRLSFRIPDRERTVVDAYRLRHQLGDDLAIGAIRRYSKL